MISPPSLGCILPHSFEWDFHMAERIAESRSRGPRKRGRTPSPNAAPAGQVQSLIHGIAQIKLGAKATTDEMVKACAPFAMTRLLKGLHW